MSWIIERDEKGEPVRMWWAGANIDFAQKIIDERERLLRQNSLPMPAMREWAKARGLIE